MKLGVFVRLTMGVGGILFAGSVFAAPASAALRSDVKVEKRDNKVKRKTKPPKAVKAEPPVIARYTGTLAARGGYLGVKSVDLFKTAKPVDFLAELSPLIEEQKAWEADVASMTAAYREARASEEEAFTACKSEFSAAWKSAKSKAERRRLKPCRRAAVPMPKLPAEPADRIATGDNMTDGIRRAFVRHMAYPKRPEGWDAKVEEIRAASDDLTRLKIANEYVNAGFPYYRRLTDPKGRRNDIARDTRWFDEWTQTPSVAFANDGDCRDYSTTKYLLLAEAGWPVERLGLTVILPAGDNAAEVGGRRGSVDILHVVTTAKSSAGTVVLDQVRREGGETMFLLGGKRSWSIAARGVLWAGGIHGSRYFQPVEAPAETMLAKAPASLPIADDETPDAKEVSE